MSRRGFTLVEILVALGLFIIASSAITGVFLMSSRSQRKTSILERVQNDGRAIMEAIATDMRIGIPDYAAYGGTAPVSTNELKLIDEDGNQISYQLSSNCSGASDPCLVRQIGGISAPITSKGVTVQNNAFYISPNINPFPNGFDQPRVTILLTLQSTESPPNQITIDLQTTVSSRVYGP